MGQDHAVEAVGKTLLRTRAGLHDPARPLGTFLFLGPSGVGKTELARQLAEHVYQRRDALIRIDMSEFGEKHTVARLIGAPPGYVGYGEGGKLTEAVRRRPYSVILFDEIEKAHPDVAQILLQVFEDGRLTDAAGKVVSFRNTICILTSNLGNRYTGRGDVIGFGELEGAVKLKSHERDLKRALQDHFKPELLGRIDRVVAFRPLGKPELERIVALEFGKLAARAAARGIKLRLTDELIAAALLRRNPDSGARFIRQFLQDEVEPQLAEVLVKQPSLKRVTVGWRGRAAALVAA
ncbi:MAG: AAA family ATPase [Candidatus Andersenbacteria bacterium]